MTRRCHCDLRQLIKSALCVVSTFYWFTFNVAYFVIGIILLTGSISQYGQTVDYEAQDWSRGAITDVVASTTGYCPTGYEQQTGLFQGLHSICYKGGTTYRIGGCGKNEGGKTRESYDEQILRKINGATICFKRDQSNNYHSLVNKRTTTSCSKTQCGSSTDQEKQFCLSQCPLNSLLVRDTNQTTLVGYGTQQTFITGWNVYYNSYNTSNSPLSQIYIGLSQPCGNGESDYSVRDKKIQAIYVEKDSECTYDNNGKINPLYQPIGFDQSEYSIYNENGILSELKVKVPDYSDESLKFNSYRLYYKSFSLWTTKCQSKYTTYQVADLASKMGELATLYTVIFALSVSLYGTQCVYWLLNAIFCACPLKCCFTFMDVLFGFLEFLLYIGLIVIYSMTANQINLIDKGMISYIHENQCSDAVMQYSFDKFYTDFEHDIAVIGIGFAFVLINFILKVLAIVLFTDLRKALFKCCKCLRCLEQSTFLERRIYQLQEDIKQRLQSFRHPQNTVIVDPNEQPFQQYGPAIQGMPIDEEETQKAQINRPEEQINNNTEKIDDNLFQKL